MGSSSSLRPTVYLDTGKLIDTEYQNGSRTRLVTLSIMSTITVQAISNWARLFGCAKVTAGVTTANYKNVVGFEGDAAVGDPVMQGLFTITFGVPPFYFYKAISSTNNGTVTQVGKWSEIDL